MDLGKGMRVMAASLSVGESSEHTSAESIARNPHCRGARRAGERVPVTSRAHGIARDRAAVETRRSEVYLLEESTRPAARDLEMHGKGILIGEGTNDAHKQAARPLALLARRNAKHVDAPVGPLVS